MSQEKKIANTNIVKTSYGTFPSDNSYGSTVFNPPKSNTINKLMNGIRSLTGGYTEIDSHDGPKNK